MDYSIGSIAHCAATVLGSYSCSYGGHVSRYQVLVFKVFSGLLHKFVRVGSHVVSIRIHCTEKWRTSFLTDVLSKSK